MVPDLAESLERRKEFAVVMELLVILVPEMGSACLKYLRDSAQQLRLASEAQPCQMVA